MIDSNFGDTFLFNVGCDRSTCWVSGCRNASSEQDRCLWNWRPTCSDTRPVSSLEANSTNPALSRISLRRVSRRNRRHRCPTLGTALVEFGFIEGISYNTDYSLYEKTYRENYTQLLNYLGFEVEAAVSSDLSLVGHIHHRSGAFGTYSGVEEGSNAYLLGLRYR